MMASILPFATTANAVRTYPSLERTALQLPAEYQLRLIRALVNGSDLSGLYGLDPVLPALNAAAHELRDGEPWGSDTGPAYQREVLL